MKFTFDEIPKPERRLRGCPFPEGLDVMFVPRLRSCRRPLGTPPVWKGAPLCSPPVGEVSPRIKRILTKWRSTKMLAVTSMIVVTSTRRWGSTIPRMAPITDSLGGGYHRSRQTRNVSWCTVWRKSGPDRHAVPKACDLCLTRIAVGGWSAGKPRRGS